MTRPAEPGPRLGGGRLRVDAARAIVKLREYQLVERAAWVLEGIRAAVASPATAITLRGDANDIWLSWCGEPWPVEDLTRLFDELVSPEAASERHHVRLLAAAVNSGLGLAPAYIDVIAIEDHTALRVRYTPDVLEDFSGELADSALRKLTTEAIPVPEGAQRGMRVHLRRRASLEVLSYLLSEPPELAIARAACADIPIALTIGTTPYHRIDHGSDVIRVPLGDGLDGFIAISDPRTTSGAVTEVAERGVILERYPLKLGGDLLAQTLPIRMLIDAPRMPTNASRSQVQRASFPIADAERRVDELVAKLLAELIAQLGAEPVEPRVRTAALAVLAALAEGGDWRRTRAVESPGLRDLANLPLLRTATGTARRLLAPWSGLVYRGREPLAEDLAPWVTDILWVPPGDPAQHLIAGSFEDRSALRRRLRWARQQRRAHRKFFAHKQRPPTVQAKTLPLIRATLGADVAGSCVPSAVFEGLAGEICIYADAGPSELVVLHHGRELERIEHESPIRFAVVIDAPLVTPDERYRGVLRNTQFARVDRAMQAGVLRAIEALASGPGAPGFIVGKPIAIEQLVRLIQGGLALARSLGASIGPPLASAPAWRTVGGEYLAHSALAGVTSVGVVEPWIEITPVLGRMMLQLAPSERALLARLMPDLPLIWYTATAARATSPAALASQMMLSNTFALAITEDTRSGAIAPIWPTEPSTITLHHRGIALVTRPYRHQLLPCKILVESDTIVPNVAWDRVVDEGSAARGYLEWETALARVAARALTDDRSLELFGPSEIGLNSALGLALWNALARLGPTELLGADLLAHVRAQRMWAVLGDPEPTSIDLLRTRYAAMIPYVALGSLPVAGFSPLIADDLVAGAVATLAGVPVREASLELESHRHAAVRAKNLEVHRAGAVQPLALPAAGESVAIEGPIVRGLVGVAPIAMEIQVFVEERPFHVIRRDDLLPLCAAVQIDATYTMPAFDGLPDDVIAEVIARVTAAAPDLLVAIAASRPQLLGDAGPTRTLFAGWSRMAGLAPATVTALRAVPMFMTVQGTRSSIDAARAPHVRTTTWTGEWLAHENDPPQACDAPVFQIADASDDLPAILRCLHGGEVDDVSDQVAKLQATRRMTRGLMPKPTIHGVPAELKRSLGDFGELGMQLGVGEIALIEDESSSALLHVGGELRKVVSINVLPAIQIAFEAPELIAELERDSPLPGIALQLRALQLDTPGEARIPQAQPLAIALARAILAGPPTLAIGRPIRRNLLRAMFGGMLAPADLAGQPVFETTAPSWIDPVAVDAQLARFGNVWSVPTAESVPQPLDPERLVLRLDPVTVQCAVERGVLIIDATTELALDERARRNRARPLATTLALPASSHILAQVTLPGDGVTGPRGVVGILHPAAAHMRGLHVHREMHPFAPRPDDLTWPILAIIDDARFEPDRTWENPIEDVVWRLAIEAVRTASTQAFLDLVKPPADALASHPLLGHGFGRGGAMRGALWIAGPPRSGAPLHVIGSSSSWDWVPRGDTGIAGIIYAQGDEVLTPALEALCEEIYPSLVRAMIRRPQREPQLVAAHAAHAMIHGRIAATEVTGIGFACFRPAPLSAIELAVLFGSTEPVHVVRADSTTPGIIDDGSPLSRVVIAQLGSRIVAERPRRGSAPAAPPVEPDHPLIPLVDVIRTRFAQIGILASDARIVDREAPMFRYEQGLEIAGDHPRLRALAAALAAGSPWVQDAVDAVIAHGVTVLNVALAEVTDATEGHALLALLDGGASKQSM